MYPFCSMPIVKSIEAIFLPMIDDSWSGGNCPLAGTLMPRAFKMDFSMVIVLPLASLI